MLIQDIQAAFISIKAALVTLRVPASLAVPTDKPGIKKADQGFRSMHQKSMIFGGTINDICL